jgi:sugar phosphate isomerase/epimerase
MRKAAVLMLFISIVSIVSAQKLPTGNPEDFKVKTCLHSVSYCGFWRGQARLSVEEFIDKAEELGYDGIMLVSKRPHVSLLDYDGEARKKLKKKIDKSGLELVCIAGYCDFTAGSDMQGVPNVEIQAVYIGEIAKLAKDLGTKMVRIYTGYERPGIAYDKQYAKVVDGLKMAGKLAAKHGITLAVQNHHDIALHHDAMRWLLDEVDMPNVKAAWDCWSPTLTGLTKEEIVEGIHTMKPHIVHTTTADYEKHPRYKYEYLNTSYVEKVPQHRAVAMGEGYLDYETFINTLKEIGYQGYITYEMCEVLKGGGSIENLDKTAKKFLEYMEQFK